MTDKQVYCEALKIARSRMGLYATTGQIKAAAKLLAQNATSEARRAREK